MATTLTPRGKCVLGNGMVMDYGDYVTDGSTTATLSVSGGYVQSVSFFDNNQNALDALSSPAVALSAKALSGNVTSYTLTPSSGAVTAGTYQVIHGGS
jgi:hypothetical protein